MIKITGDELGWTTTGRDSGSTWIVRFVNFRKEIHDMCARCGGNKILGSFRKTTSGDKDLDDARDGGLVGGSQIPVNPAVKSSVTELPVCFIAI